jgi:voltage-gated sodium channel
MKKQNSLTTFVSHPKFERLTIWIIFINAFVLGIGTYKLPGDLATFLHIVDQVCLLYFAVEVSLRIAAFRMEYFKNAWNWFDLLVVAVSILSQHPSLAVFRVLRVLRLLMLISKIKSLKLITTVMLKSIPACGSITLLMMLCLFIFGMVGVGLFGTTNAEYFGNLHTAMYTLFQVSFLFDYSSPVDALREAHPYVDWYMMPYFMIMSCIVINFFSGILLFLIYELSLEEIKTGVLQDEAELEARDEEEAKDQNSVASNSEIELSDSKTLSDLLEEIRKLNARLDQRGV